ncbi:MAG: hypothetical protein ACOVNY_03060 [Chitinophagaceae bacterium]
MKTIFKTTAKQAIQVMSKKLMMAAVITIAAATTAFANPTPSTNENYRAESHFNSNFKGAVSVTWVTTSKFIKASFVKDGVKMEAFYNFGGDLIGTSKAIGYDKLPKNAINKISKNYPAPPYTVKAVIEFVNENDEANYYVSLDNGKETTVLEINKDGNTSFFKKTKN